RTPSALINILKDKHGHLFSRLLEYEDFVKINKVVTSNLKNTILSLDRVPKAQEYRDTDFELFTDAIQAIEKLSLEKVYSYFPVSHQEMETALNRDEKPLLLFKISNRDLSYADTYSKGLRKSRGNENLHTQYFKLLMSAQ